MPVDPSLRVGGTPVLPSLAGLGGDTPVGGTGGKTASVVVADGMPPITSRLLDKIRRWDYVDLALLIGEPGPKAEEIPSLNEERVVLFQSLEQAQRRRKQIGDIQAWSQAFAVFMAALASASFTTTEEVVGLIAHSHLILQLAKDMGGLRWLKYDQEYREWAAAKGIRKWGELNLSIYGRCLAVPLPAASPAVPPAAIFSTPLAQPRRGEKRGKLSRGTPKKGGACFRWNFEGACSQSDCHYTHTCYNCGESHQVVYCPRAPKRHREEGPGQ